MIASHQVEGAFRKRMAIMEDITPDETGALVGASLQAHGTLRASTRIPQARPFPFHSPPHACSPAKRRAECMHAGTLSRLFEYSADETPNRFLSKLRDDVAEAERLRGQPKPPEASGVAEERSAASDEPSGHLPEPTGEGGTNGHLSDRDIEWVQNEARHVKGRSLMPLLALLRRVSYRRFRTEAILQVGALWLTEPYCRQNHIAPGGQTC